jgi:general secretion pathway protein A
VNSSNPIAPEVYYRDKSLLQYHAAYEGFFGLKENPFSLTPDPRYLFRTRHAHETLRQLTRGMLTRKGLLLLSGEVGTGKTTLLNTALHALKENPEVGGKTRTAVLVHPTLTREELVEAILSDFNVPCAATRKPRRLQALQEMLLEVRRKGGVAVLAVDEAQLLTHELLDEIRILLSLRSGQEELLQVVLCGQPEMERKLNRSSLSRLQPPVTVRCKTVPLTQQDTHDYIEHRLKVAGAMSESMFTKDAADAVHLQAHGIPRVVNLLCAHALSAAGLRGVRHITSQMIDEVAAKLPFPEAHPPGRRSRGLHPGNGATPKPPSSQSAPNGEEARKLGAASKIVPRECLDTRTPPASQFAPGTKEPRKLGSAWKIVPRVSLDTPKPPPPAIAGPDRASHGQHSLPSILPRTLRLNRRWTVDFDQKRYWMLLCNMALIGALFLALARGAGSPAPWQHAARAVLGFSGLLLLDVSLGLAAYLFLYERRTQPRLVALAKFFGAAYKRLSALFFLATLRLAKLGPRDPTRRS